MDEIKVTVVEFSNRKCFQLQYRDPMTRLKKTKTTDIIRDGTKKARTAAERAAATWEDELRSGRYVEPSKLTWEEFRLKYEGEVLAGLAKHTGLKVVVVFNAVEAALSPVRLRDLTADRLSYFQRTLRDRGLAESTIAGMLDHLRAALNWAAKIGLIDKAPRIERPKRAKGGKVMKGRAITTEEFERMLAATEGVVGEQAATLWKDYLKGLWASGLRLEESLALWWDRDDRIRPGWHQRRPMLFIPAELEKGHTDRVHPMAPEFAAFLEETPTDERKGPVFKLKGARGSRLKGWHVSKIVSAIGKAAGVKVNTDAKGKVKFASAHDLRRAFGARWASRLMPQQLMEVMRHADIQTTLRYYVGQNADRTADALWSAYEGKSNEAGNTAAESATNSRD